MKYVPTIGLEIHAQLKTKTKLFCDSLNDPFESHPNINICPICMGHPGVLPQVNKQAIDFMLLIGLALNSKIAVHSKFDRKNYFYPDLPKGYQISQYDKPFCLGGYLDIELKNHRQRRGPVQGGDKKSSISKRIKIERIHLEEDAARLVHPDNSLSRGSGRRVSLVDFNRAGVPLMELVTMPSFHSATEVRVFAQELRLILRYLGVSDANLEKGQMRVEVNISLAPENKGVRLREGRNKIPVVLGTKVELKNLNSLRVVQDATAYEIERQTKLLKSKKKIIQETRGWDEVKNITFSQRIKEEAHDYRYFPEPDLPIVHITKKQGFDLDKIKASLPELPQAKRLRFIKEYNLNKDVANIFVEEKELAQYYEGVVSEALEWSKNKAIMGSNREEARDQRGGRGPTPVAKSGVDLTDEEKDKVIKLTTNYIIKNLRTILQKHELPVEELKITGENFGELISLIFKGEISSSAAREVLEEMFDTGKDPSDIIIEKGLEQISDEGALEKIIEYVLQKNENAVNDYKKGKNGVLKFLVGKVMASSKGSANPQVAAELLKKKLK